MGTEKSSLSAPVQPVVIKAVELREIVTELFEHREYAECWFPDYRGFEDAWGNDLVGDCGNWDNCSDDCPIVKLRTAAGIKPTDHGGVEA